MVFSCPIMTTLSMNPAEEGFDSLNIATRTLHRVPITIGRAKRLYGVRRRCVPLKDKCDVEQRSVRHSNAKSRSCSFRMFAQRVGHRARGRMCGGAFWGVNATVGCPARIQSVAQAVLSLQTDSLKGRGDVLLQCRDFGRRCGVGRFT